MKRLPIGKKSLGPTGEDGSLPSGQSVLHSNKELSNVNGECQTTLQISYGDILSYRESKKEYGTKQKNPPTSMLTASLPKRFYLLGLTLEIGDSKSTILVESLYLEQGSTLTIKLENLKNV